MIKYIIKRVLVGMLTLFILATITFFGVHYMPGNPFEQDNKRMTQAQYDSLNAKFGLDQPLGTQYVMFLKNFSCTPVSRDQGRFRRVYLQKRPSGQ